MLPMWVRLWVIDVTKTKFSRFIVLVFSVIVFCAILMGAAPEHTTQFYINDFADVLSEETESEILNTALAMNNETSAQVVVLTIPDLDGEDIADYAVETARSWGIGNEDKDNGVLIVLALEEREVWVSVGYGLEGTLTDMRTGQLLDQYAVPYYSVNDFDTGTLHLFNAIVNEIRVEEYGLEPLNDIEWNGQPTTYPGDIQTEGDLRLFLLIISSPFLLIGFTMLGQFFKYLHLLRYDKKHGTNNAPIYRKKYMGARKAILSIIVRSALHGGAHSSRNGRGGGGGFRGGGGGFGGGGAGRGF